MNDREIKFRYVFKHQKDGDFQFLIFTLNQIQNGEAKLFIETLSDNYKLVARNQFTGRHGKNGEIYECDILQADDPRDKLTFSVKWYDHGGFNLLGINTVAFLVIGNVYIKKDFANEAAPC